MTSYVRLSSLRHTSMFVLYTAYILLFSGLLLSYDIKRIVYTRFLVFVSFFNASNILGLLITCFFLGHVHAIFLKTNDYCAIPQQLKDQLSERYPEARRAYLKSGGDFPFLSRPDEVNLHLQVQGRSQFYLF